MFVATSICIATIMLSAGNKSGDSGNPNRPRNPYFVSIGGRTSANRDSFGSPDAIGSAVNLGLDFYRTANSIQPLVFSVSLDVYTNSNEYVGIHRQYYVPNIAVRSYLGKREFSIDGKQKPSFYVGLSYGIAVNGQARGNTGGLLGVKDSQFSAFKSTVGYEVGNFGFGYSVNSGNSVLPSGVVFISSRF